MYAVASPVAGAIIDHPRADVDIRPYSKKCVVFGHRSIAQHRLKTAFISAIRR